MIKLKKIYFVNISIILFMIIIPSMVLASIPTSTSFDRHNTYELDGYRDGGYYAIRDNPLIDGYMNMSHIGGTNIFNITTYNIKNVTLDFELMFERRSFLFGWVDVTWQDVVDSLGNNITINIITDGKLENMQFVDQPNVWVKIWKDGEVYKGWNILSDIELDSTGLDSGSHIVIIQFQQSMTLIDIIKFLLSVLIIIGIVKVIFDLIKSILLGDNGDYYKRAWNK